MDSFLHSNAWERLQKRAGAHPLRIDNQLFLQKKFSGLEYWQSSRIEIDDTFSISPFKATSFLRIEPLDTASKENLDRFAKKNNLRLEPTFAIQPRQTSVVDLTLSYDEIIANLKSKHRYNIRVAQKHEIEVEIVSTQVSESFDRFWTLLTETADRHDFRTHTKEYYRQTIEELEKDDMVHILFAKKGPTDLATLLLISYKGVATYLHGGSTQAHKEMMAPYLLHAKTIEYAQKLQCTSYDLWGTDLQWNREKEQWQTKDGPSSGTSRFKLGFNGTIVQYPGAFDLILKPFWYTLYKTIRNLRSKKRSFS